MDWEQGVAAEPLAQAWHDVMLAAAGRDLRRCAVIGCGSIGSWILHALRLRATEAESGAKDLGHIGPVTAVDPEPTQRERALYAGAQYTAVGTEELPDGEFETVFDVVGSPQARQEALRLTANGGTVIAVGLGSNEVAIPWFDIIRREITVRGANCFTAEDYVQALRWLSAGSVSAPTAPEQALELPLEEAPAVFERLAVGERLGKVFFSPV